MTVNTGEERLNSTIVMKLVLQSPCEIQEVALQVSQVTIVHGKGLERGTASLYLWRVQHVQRMSLDRMELRYERRTGRRIC